MGTLIGDSGFFWLRSLQRCLVCFFGISGSLVLSACSSGSASLPLRTQRTVALENDRPEYSAGNAVSSENIDNAFRSAARTAVSAPDERPAPLPSWEPPFDSPNAFPGYVFLWCENPQADLCREASTLLDVASKPGHALPDFLLSDVADQNDCEDQGIAALRHKLHQVNALGDDMWTDQVGSPLPRESLGDAFVAAGCLACLDAGPGIKISRSATRNQFYLVRIFESCR